MGAGVGAGAVVADAELDAFFATTFFLLGLEPSTLSVGSCVSCARAASIDATAMTDTPASSNAPAFTLALEMDSTRELVRSPTLRNTMTQLSTGTEGWLAGARSMALWLAA
jgi:hypothetical protein